MILKQYYLGCLAHASYLIADERTRVAAVVDPQRDVDQYLADAQELGVTIQHVFLTHFHADFVAGHLELRDRAGARIHLGARAEAEFDFTPVKDGDVVEFGDVRLSILETPGHTPEGISIVIHDLAQSDREPHAVLTGDTLFIGDVGRPDLLASFGVSQGELASMLYDSLHGKLLQLPDSTLVYPAHGAGSMCGKKLSTETMSTMGEQRRYNYALQPMTKEQFTALVTAEQPDAPAYFGYDAVLNRKERPTLEQSLERALVALRRDEALAHAKGGAQLVDVRSAAEYAGGHLAGSLNVGLDGSFATWAGSVLDPARPIVIVAEPGREREAATRLARVGFDRVAGFVAGGMAAFEARADLVRTSQRITAQALAERLADRPAPLLVDVRTPGEWQAGHVVVSVNIPLNRLRERLGELPRERELALICRTGYRSSLAASLLAQAGFERILDVTGGIEAWRASRLPEAAPAA
jgi:glyoxylase-like metal-dependent hydrolase (beta-lactamase superfamily II)